MSLALIQNATNIWGEFFFPSPIVRWNAKQVQKSEAYDTVARVAVACFSGLFAVAGAAAVGALVVSQIPVAAVLAIVAVAMGILAGSCLMLKERHSRVLEQARASLGEWKSYHLHRAQRNPNAVNEPLRIAMKYQDEDSFQRFHFEIQQERLQSPAPYYQVYDLQQHFKKDHYVFVHAASPFRGYLFDLIRACQKRKKPNQVAPMFKSLRDPQELGEAWFLKDIDQLRHEIDDADPNTAKKLISCNAYLCDFAHQESGFAFFRELHGRHRDRPRLERHLSAFIERESSSDDRDRIQRMAIDHLDEIERDPAKEASLYVICIPKKVIQDPSQNFVYTSHPRGKLCHCHGDMIQLLDQLQESKRVECDGSSGVPQFRILADHLIPQNGVKILRAKSGQTRWGRGKALAQALAKEIIA